MEREAPVEKYHVMRAVRSLAYNRELKPVIDGRIERAEGKVRGYMLTNNQTTTRIGVFQVEIDEGGDLVLTRLEMDDWQQLSLPKVTELPGNVEERIEVEEPIVADARIDRAFEQRRSVFTARNGNMLNPINHAGQRTK